MTETRNRTTAYTRYFAAALKCHGKPDIQIAKEMLEKIKARYPNDLATGFALNDFRGAWKITFMN